MPDAFAATKCWSLPSVRHHCLALLAHSLKQHNRDSCSQVKASRPVHWDEDAIMNVGGEHVLRQPFRFPTKNQEVLSLKLHLVIRTLAFCRQKKIARVRRLPLPQRFKRIPQLRMHFLPVIQTCSAQFSIVERKAKRFHQVQA